jgi:hypothetical protein
MFTRLVFTGDIFRTSEHCEPNQLGNVEWLFRTFSPILSEITGLTPEIRFRGNDPQRSAELVTRYYAALNESPSTLAWARTFWAKPPEQLFDLLRDDYQDALVVSFESSPLLQGIFARLDIPWIDLQFSPIRFLRDFVISFKLSHHFDGRFPNEARMSAETIQNGVNRIRSFYRNHPPDRTIDDSVIFFAQTEQDRTLIRDRRFVTVADVLPPLSALLKGRRLLFKAHPLAPNNPILQQCIAELGGTIIDKNTYEILSRNPSATVVTASSSVGVEAKVFGLDAHTLNDGVQQWAFSGPQTLHAWRDPNLWRTLLKGFCKNSERELQSTWSPNLLRHEIGKLYYGLDPAIWSFCNQPEGDRIDLTNAAIAERRTLIERWEILAESEPQSDRRRLKIASALIGRTNAVADHGCGTMALEGHLHRKTKYVPIDVCRRDDRTVVCDFNKEPIPETGADVAACLDILEYIFDPQQFMQAIVSHYPRCVVSYGVADAAGSTESRRAKAWVNDLTRADIENLFVACGWKIDETRFVDDAEIIWALSRPGEKKRRRWFDLSRLGFQSQA